MLEVACFFLEWCFLWLFFGMVVPSAITKLDVETMKSKAKTAIKVFFILASLKVVKKRGFKLLCF